MTQACWRPAYVGVGSNLGMPAKQIESAMSAMQQLPDTVLVLESGLYLSKPLGPQDQPDYVNAVAALLTQLDAGELLDALQDIERVQGRDRSGERWGPRSIDLDLLAFSAEVHDEEGLQVPHPRIAERNFVLLPWAEIAPTYLVPGLSTVAELARRAPDEPCIERLA